MERKKKGEILMEFFFHFLNLINRGDAAGGMEYQEVKKCKNILNHLE